MIGGSFRCAGSKKGILSCRAPGRILKIMEESWCHCRTVSQGSVRVSRSFWRLSAATIPIGGRWRRRSMRTSCGLCRSSLVPKEVSVLIVFGNCMQIGARNYVTRRWSGTIVHLWNISCVSGSIDTGTGRKWAPGCVASAPRCFLRGEIL